MTNAKPQAPLLLRNATQNDFPRILALNLNFERFLSPLSETRLAHLHRHSAYHRVAVIDGEVQAFLIGFREDADYDSPNYRWFAARYPKFQYVDRIVISASAQGQQLGSRLYEDFFALAKANAVPVVTCEFDIDPPNEVSRQFHLKFGFREVGRQQVGASFKTVSLQSAAL